MSFLSSSQLLITNINGNYVEEFNLDANTIVPYIGECSSTRPEMIEGHRLNEVKLRRPVGITYDGRGTVFTGLGSSRVIIATEVSNDLTSLFNHVPDVPRYLRFDIDSQKLFATLNNGFVRISNDSVEYIIAESSAGQGREIGPLVDTRVDSLNAFIMIIDGVWLLADWKNNR